MVYIEIDNKDLRLYGKKEAIKQGLFMVWSPRRIKSAFKGGHGTQADFMRYKTDNKIFCTCYDMPVKELLALYPDIYSELVREQIKI